MKSFGEKVRVHLFQTSNKFFPVNTVGENIISIPKMRKIVVLSNCEFFPSIAIVILNSIALCKAIDLILLCIGF